ncbi:MAG: hypothetical protein KBD50_00430 [Candidatus Pacebacteria bacterium]|nr:hypothetical protein [Candidatus Paceibacterota bacterium]
MTRNISRIIAQTALLSLLVLAGSAPIAFASEVTGSLSSDGSTDQSGSGSLLGGEEATIMNVKGEQALSGTVVNGIDGGQGTNAFTTALLWSLPVILAAGIFLTITNWRKKSI